MQSGSKGKTLSLCAVGDVMPNRKEPEKFFDLCADVLKSFDVRLCQLETNFSDRGSRYAAARVPTRANPRNVEALKAGGFDVVTYASNHTFDNGVESMEDTIYLLRKNGMEVLGAGKNLPEARRPVILERKGIKLAFLDYCSVLPAWSWAGESKPGVSPLRIKTLYEMIEADQPGCGARIFTYPDEADMNSMLEDIRKAKSKADVLILSLHWGLHFVRAKLAGYQRQVARAAIDAGADVIIGTHAHILKGIEVYKGKAIFYSLGNFALDSNFRTWPNITPAQEELLKEYNWVIDPAWAKTYPFAPDSRKTMAVKCIISNKGIERVSFLPGMINIDARPRILSHSDEAFHEVLKYMEEITEEAGLNARYKVEGDEVIVQTCE
jgi:poly-gamma-glutamate capsule biosynthesis protein CapA/YwtB (metallophosphatase superfamily)